jgi:trehalose-phosphatase
MVRRSTYDRLLREMQEIRYRLDDIERSMSKWKPEPVEISESELLFLPDHLRKTYMAVASKGNCSATEVSNLTGRCRAVESNYLNQLVRAGWLMKQRSSKEIRFLVLNHEANQNSKLKNLVKPEPAITVKPQAIQIKKPASFVHQKMKIECFSSDFDGTISPIDALRRESHVPLDTRVMLREISTHLPMSIITMKDLSFVVPRTPFAHAWSAIGGLEMQVGRRILKRENLESKMSIVASAISYAMSQVTVPGVEIEEKNDAEGRTVAFCVDYRQAKNLQAAVAETEQVANYCKSIGLEVFRYGNQPFYDVYPCDPDKGQALKGTLDELKVKKGVLYLGDSEMDNSAFNVSNLSLGVVHDETPVEALNCDYFVTFENVPLFLRTLIRNNLEFSSDFPMIKRNQNKQQKRSNTHNLEKLSVG